MIRKLVWLAIALVATPAILVLPATEAGMAKAEVPQANCLCSKVYTIAAGPDQLPSAPANYLYVAYVSDVPGGPSWMTSNGTTWVVSQGPQGIQGPAGPTGPQGPAGADGILSIQRARVTTATNGTVTWTFPTPFGAGVVPRVWAQVVASSGTTDVVNVQTDGAPTNTAVNLRVTRTQQSVVALLGLTILSVPGTIGAQQVDVFAVAP